MTLQTHTRLLALDVFRGITIVTMILVNSPGNNTAYPWLLHSVWNGCTPTDCIFPFFIFIVGISLVFSLTKGLATGVSSNTLLRKVFFRCCIIFLLGLALNGFPHYDLSSIRIPGVLQRIAVCCFFASFLFLKTSTRTQAITAAILLIGYWALMTYVPVPGIGSNDLSVTGNLAGYIDRLWLMNHMYTPGFDPEGFLSTLPAIASALLGNLTGIFLLSQCTPQHKITYLVLASTLALITGWLWGLSFPINKELWTSSFVLWTTGLALALFSFCYYILEIKQIRLGSKFFEIFGLNAIAAYILHILFLKIQNRIDITTADGKTQNLRLFITKHLFPYVSAHNASLLYALSYILLWFLVLWILYRRRIFIRV